jgi:hypothetical protein
MEAHERRGLRVLPWVAIALLAVALGVRADEPQQGSSGAGESAAKRPSVAAQLLGVSTGDPLELARVVERVGDGAVIGALDAKQPTAVRLQAIRAARELRAPELALGALIAVMGGRDPLLAPGAGRSVRAIAHRLAHEELSVREASALQLRPHVAALRELAARAHLRADLQAMALEAVALLEPLLPASEGAAEADDGDG